VENVLEGDERMILKWIIWR